MVLQEIAWFFPKESFHNPFKYTVSVVLQTLISANVPLDDFLIKDGFECAVRIMINSHNFILFEILKKTKPEIYKFARDIIEYGLFEYSEKLCNKIAESNSNPVALLEGLGPKISELFDSMTNVMIKLDPNLTVDFVDKFIYSIFPKFKDAGRESLLKHTVGFFEKVLGNIERLKSHHLQNFFQ